MTLFDLPLKIGLADWEQRFRMGMPAESVDVLCNLQVDMLEDAIQRCHGCSKVLCPARPIVPNMPQVPDVRDFAWSCLASLADSEHRFRMSLQRVCQLTALRCCRIRHMLKFEIGVQFAS